MRRLFRESGFAFAAWLLPFVMSVCVDRLRDTHRPLFEIVMSLTLTTTTALLALISCAAWLETVCVARSRLA